LLINATSGNGFIAVPAVMYKKSPPILQTHLFTANDTVCLAVLVVAIIATLYSISLAGIVEHIFVVRVAPVALR